jgi:hypothetical protein
VPLVGGLETIVSDRTFDDFEDFAPVSGDLETVELLSMQMAQAGDLSQRFSASSQQWSNYLVGLALAGFTNWLRQRDSQMVADQDDAWDWQATHGHGLAVGRIAVQDFQVCVIPTLSCGEPEVALPRAVVDLPEFVAHFYVVVGVEPDLAMAAMLGWLSYEQLVSQTVHQAADDDWHYLCPVTWFSQHSLADLLLYLRCLPPTAIALPAIPPRRALLAQVQAGLLSRLPHGQGTFPQATLTWDEVTAVLTSPPLLQWLRRPTDNSPPLSDLLQGLVQPVIQVGQWLQDNAMGNWNLAVADQLRGESQDPGNRLTAILMSLQQTQGLWLPADALRIYQDIELGTLALRLYSVIWPAAAEWMVLWLVEVLADSPVTGDLRLRISDPTECLVAETVNLAMAASDGWGVQVAGDHGDLLFVTLVLSTGESITLAPLALPEVEND